MKTFFSSSIDWSIFLWLIYTVLNSDFVFKEKNIYRLPIKQYHLPNYKYSYFYHLLSNVCIFGSLWALFRAALILAKNLLQNFNLTCFVQVFIQIRASLLQVFQISASWETLTHKNIQKSKKSFNLLLHFSCRLLLFSFKLWLFVFLNRIPNLQKNRFP